MQRGKDHGEPRTTTKKNDDKKEREGELEQEGHAQRKTERRKRKTDKEEARKNQGKQRQIRRWVCATRKPRISQEKQKSTKRQSAKER